MHSEAFAQQSCYTDQVFTQGNFYTQKLLHGASFVLTHRNFNTQRTCYTEKLYSREEVFTQKSCCREQVFTQRIFSQRICYTETLIHGETVTQSKLLQRRFYTEKDTEEL